MPKVLVIDDDAALLRMIRLTLRLEGFEVVTATDGQLGLDRVVDSSPDVVAVDLQMPIMDGRAFYRVLRSDGHRVPVLIMSANGALEARRELGANAAITKPFEPAELVSTIRRLVAEQERASGASQ